MTKRVAVETGFERVLFASRWLMAPFYAGLVVALLALMVQFLSELVKGLPQTLAFTQTDMLLWVLDLIDMSLAGNLLLMVVLAGYENFVSKIDTRGNPDRPDWMGKIDFSGMKLKLIASVVAISGIHLLKVFMSIDHADTTYDVAKVSMLVGIHLAFIVSGVLLAFMDWIAEHAKKVEGHH